MTEGLPAWQPFPLSPEDPAPSLSVAGRPALVLLASPATDRSGWAVRAAALLARRRAGSEGRLLLADLDLRRPRLHAELGADNGEGMSDAFLFGASLGRVARPVDGGFLFVPAGTAVADPSRVLGSSRWDAVTEGFEGAGAEMFLYLPWDLPGREAIVERAGHVVLLAEREELGALELGGMPIDAVLGPGEDGPAGGPSPPAAASAVDPRGARQDAEEESAAEAGVTTDSPPPALDPTTAASSGGARAGRPRRPRLEEGAGYPRFGPDASRRAGRRGSRTLMVAVFVVVLLLLAVLAAALAGWIDVPGVPRLIATEWAVDAGTPPASPAETASPGEAAGAAAAPSAGTAAAEVGAAEVRESLPSLERSMAVGSYRDLDEALSAVAELSARDSGLVVVVSPVDVNGVSWHRILLAPLPEGRSEASVRTALARQLGNADPSGWFQRPTPLAFQILETGSLEAGRAHLRELLARGIPAYVLETRSPSAPRGPVYRVYAGAYAGLEEARHMESLLREAGLDDIPLVPRRGRSPGTSPVPPA